MSHVCEKKNKKYWKTKGRRKAPKMGENSP